MSEPTREQRARQDLGHALELAGIEVPAEMFERLVLAYRVLSTDLEALHASREDDGSEGKRS